MHILIVAAAAARVLLPLADMQATLIAESLLTVGQISRLPACLPACRPFTDSIHVDVGFSHATFVTDDEPL